MEKKPPEKSKCEERASKRHVPSESKEGDNEDQSSVNGPVRKVLRLVLNNQ